MSEQTHIHKNLSTCHSRLFSAITFVHFLKLVKSINMLFLDLEMVNNIFPYIIPYPHPSTHKLAHTTCTRCKPSNHPQNTAACTHIHIKNKHTLSHCVSYTQTYAHTLNLCGVSNSICLSALSLILFSSSLSRSLFFYNSSHTEPLLPYSSSSSPPSLSPPLLTLSHFLSSFYSSILLPFSPF